MGVLRKSDLLSCDFQFGLRVGFGTPLNKCHMKPIQDSQNKIHFPLALSEDHSTLKNKTKVKICGVNNLEDAITAAKAGAAYVGMIVWPHSRRSVSIDTAKSISHAVRQYGAQPVGVFVDEDAETICNACKEANIDIAQLHGEGARSSLEHLPSYLKKIYVLNVNKSGVIQTALPREGEMDWVLLDSLKGGSGHKFDWENVKTLTLDFKTDWFLAGGLNPENVGEAISILKPDVVDVSSGVTLPDGIFKDPKRISEFMNAVHSSSSS